MTQDIVFSRIEICMICKAFVTQLTFTFLRNMRSHLYLDQLSRICTMRAICTLFTDIQGVTETLAVADSIGIKLK